jgi:hypothetical protein
VRRRLSIVSGFFAFLQARGDVAANPVPRGLPTRRERSRPGQGVPLVRVTRRLPRILSPAEVDTLTAALRTHLDMTLRYARIASRTVVDEYFAVTGKVDALYGQAPRAARRRDRPEDGPAPHPLTMAASTGNSPPAGAGLRQPRCISVASGIFGHIDAGFLGVGADSIVALFSRRRRNHWSPAWRGSDRPQIRNMLLTCVGATGIEPVTPRL